MRPRKPPPKSGRRKKSAQREREAETERVVSLFPKERQERTPGETPRTGRPTSKAKDEFGKPEDARKRNVFRLGKRWSQIHQEVRDGDYTWEDFVERLTPEELARGQLKASDGTFTGRPPSFVPREFHQACLRELYRRFNDEMRGNLIKATQELIEIGMSHVIEPKDRIKVLQFVIERVMGKVPDKVEVHAADPWETIIADILTDSELPGQLPYADRINDAE